MSGAVLGAIEVQMLLDLARWQNDVTNAGRVMDQGMAKIKSSVSGALGGLMAGLSVAAFTTWIKGAIDAGDATKEFSQKTGIAAKDVAGLQLAFRQGGVDSEALATSIGKLGKQMVEGNAAFKTLGVETRNTDGTMRDVMDVMYDTADAFAGIEDGAAKSALAQEIFGKSGAALIPTLNEGSEGMRQMAEMADKLGLTISAETAEAADKFNDTLDLLGQGSQGMARQVAAELLPTLNSLAGTLLKNKLEGDGMRKMADGIAASLKVLFSIGAIGVEVFQTVGKVVGGVLASIVAVTNGEFSQAQKILEESGRDIAKGWGNTAQTIEDAWTGAGAKSVESMTAMTSGLRKLTPATKDQEAANKKAAEELAKLVKAGQDYAEGINTQYGLMQRQVSLGRELTEGEKELAKMEEQLAKGKMVLTDAERLSVEMKLREIDAVKEAKARQEDYLKTVAAVAAHASKWADEQARTTDGMRAANVALMEQNDRLRLGDEAWTKREQAVLLNQAADLEWQAANEGGNFQLEEQARLLRQRAQLLADGTVLKEAKAVSDEWKKTTESIQNGLTDALMRGFENGKGFLDNFADVLKSAFKTLILKPMVQSMVGQLSGGLQSAMGWIGSMTGQASSSGAGGSSTGAAAGAAGASSSGGLGWAGWILAGIQQSRSDYAKGWNRSGLDQGWNKNINWAINPVYSSMIKPLEKLGLINSKTADILGGDTAMARMFGRKPAEATAQGITGSFGGGSFAGQQFVDWTAKGGWFRKDKSGTQLSDINEELAATLKEGAAGLLEQSTDYAKALGLPVGALTKVTSSARVVLGDDAAKNAEAIAKAMADYGDALAGTFQKELAAAAKPGESAAETLNRLGEAISAVNTTFEALGLHLVQTSVAGGQAASELVKLTGGMDAFLAKTQAYLQGYFTEAEQMGLGAGNVLKTLKDAGIDFSGATQRQDLRSLMEGLDPNSTSGRQQMAALLGVAGDFAKLTDYLAANNLTLGQLAGQAPTKGVPMAEDPATRSAAAAEASAAALATSNERLATIAEGTANTVEALSALLVATQANQEAMAEQLAALAQALEDAARMNDISPGPVGGGGL